MGLILLLSVSVSLDTLGIGMSYAIEGIRIPWQTRFIVALTNMVLTFMSVLLAVSGWSGTGSMAQHFWRKRPCGSGRQNFMERSW